jgi:hypothetical protein
MTTKSDGAVPSMIIMKTRPEHMRGVIDSGMHACDDLMHQARPGDLLLVAVMVGIVPAIVTHAMRLKKQYRDYANRSQAIWERRWRYLVDGEEGCCPLESPFCPQYERAPGSTKNYGKGARTFVYVDRGDAEEFARKGLLSPLLPPSGSN